MGSGRTAGLYHQSNARAKQKRRSFRPAAGFYPTNAPTVRPSFLATFFLCGLPNRTPMCSMPSILRPVSSLPSRTGLAARAPARTLCVSHTADAQRGDQHDRNDQFLYRWSTPQKTMLVIGSRDYIAPYQQHTNGALPSGARRTFLCREAG